VPTFSNGTQIPEGGLLENDVALPSPSLPLEGGTPFWGGPRGQSYIDARYRG